MPYGAVQNSAGKFVRASIEAVTRGRRGGGARCRRTSASRSPIRQATDAYPIASFTWLLLYENPQDKAQAKVMVDFMKWALTDGQKFAPELGYAPLPKNVVDMETESAPEDQAAVDGQTPIHAPVPTRCCFAPERVPSPCC